MFHFPPALTFQSHSSLQKIKQAGDSYLSFSRSENRGGREKIELWHVTPKPGVWVSECCVLIRAWLFATPWTVAHQTPLFMGLSRQEYWSGLPFPSSGDLQSQGLNPCLLCLLHWQAGYLPLVSPLTSGVSVFKFHAAVIICSDFGAQEIKSVTNSTFSLFICHEVIELDVMNLVFLMS